MRITIEMSDCEEGLAVEIKGELSGTESIGADGVAETSLASITAHNLMLNLAQLVRTTGLKVRMV